jgi:hypothetical protein
MILKYQLLSILLVLLLLLLVVVITSTTASSDDNNKQQEGPCTHSIFETRVPFFEAVPDEKANRLQQQPAKHPDRNLCGSYKGKDSCCTETALQDLQRWSDGMDAWVQAIQYFEYMISNNPKAFLDQILVILKIFIHNNPPIDWVIVRNAIRDEAGDLIKSLADHMIPPGKQILQTILTYEEGLLCSACEPNFNRFLDLNKGTLLLRSDAAAEVSDAVLAAFHALDAFFGDDANIRALKHVSEQGCASALKSSLKCVGVGTGVGLALGIFTGPALRTIVCGAPAGGDGVPDAYCRDMIMNQVLRGLYVDPSVVIDNQFNWVSTMCSKFLSEEQCAPIKTYKKEASALFYSFDTRPIVTNDYHSVDGFDVKGTACASHLSGYGCSGNGPEPVDHGSMPTVNQGGLSVGAIIGIVLTCVIVSGLGIGLIWRRQIKSGVTSLYYRMRDGEGGGGVDGRLDSVSSGPLVGLV